MNIEQGVGFPIYAKDAFSGAFNALKKEIGAVTSMLGPMQQMLTFGALAGGIAAVMKAAREGEEAQRRLEAVLRATGNTTGYTSKQLNDLADSLARTSRFDDEGFRNATATLVRFGNIGGDNLEKVLKLSADYAALTGSELPEAAEKLGRALNNPAEGVSKLEKGFGDLGKEIVEQIKQQDQLGNRSGALAIAIEALQKKIGGGDEAMNQGVVGAVRGLNKAVSELFETIGGFADNWIIVKVLDDVAARLRGIKAVMEGPWTDSLALLVGIMTGKGGEMLSALGNRKPAAIVPGASGATAMADYMAMAEIEQKQEAAYAAALAKLRLEKWEKEKKAREEWLKNEQKARELDAAGWVRYAEAVFAEADDMNRAIAASNADFWDGQDKMREEDLKGWVAHADAVFEEADQTNLAIAKINEDRTKAEEGRWTGFIGGIDSAFRDTWDAFVTKGASAGRVLRESLKRTFFDWLYQQFAKPFVLNIVASVGNSLGLPGLGSAATAAAGSGGLGGLGSIFSAAGSFLGGPELLAGAPTFLEGLGGMMTAAGPYVAAIMAVYALYETFKDKGENWKGKLGFGSNANAYTTEGIFGREGFEYLAGDDTTNRAIQTFMGSTRGLDTRLASRLTPAQIAAISGRLSGSYSTRNDGQPAEFAFGKDDSTAAQQLTMEYLQKKYGTIFDTIDTEFAEFIRGYTGKSEDLLKAIIEFAGILDALDAVGIKGLNITTLRLFKREGEELGATFERIAKQWATYQDLFYSDAEKIGMAQDSVNAVFESLGIAVPSSMEEFRKLVDGLDLTTEAGRKMFEALMTIAPGFASVANAAKSLLTTFDQIVGSMRPGYSRGVLEQSLQSEVMKFMGGAAWTQGMDWQYVAGQLRNIERSDFQNYSLAQQQIITTILSIMSQLDALDNSAGDAAGSVGTLGSSAQSAAAAMADAKEGLWQYLQGLFVNPALSPLDPTQQLGLAKNQFLEQLGLARGGDAGAAAGLSGYIDNVLNLGRTVFASGPGYTDLFSWITTLAGDFARPGGGQELQRLAYQEAQRQTARLDMIYDAIMLVANQGPSNAAYVADASLVSGDTVAMAVKSSGLETKRR